MEIRLLKENDYSLILEMIPDDSAFQMFLGIAQSVKENDGVSYTYGAFVNGMIVGFIYGFILPNKTLLPQYLYVDKNYRGQHIGKQLLRKFEKESKCNCSIIYFEKGLNKYYMEEGYTIGSTLTALKPLSYDNEKNIL